ncbi:MAG: hypothetical protein Aurels2KO_05180 [Aureliella sp.]
MPTTIQAAKANANDSHFLIVAYSGRALAHAAKAASLYVTVADQFGDSDTLQIADAYVPLDFPPPGATPKLQAACEPLRDLFRPNRSKLGRLPPISGVLLGGGCENRPGLIRHIQSFAGDSVLAGLPSPEAIRQLRDRKLWEAASKFTGCRFPTSMSAASFSAQVAPHASNLHHTWLLKAPDSAGGLGVRRIASNEPLPDDQPNRSIVQQFIPGRQLGVTLIIAPNGTRLAGCTESLSGQDWQPSTLPPNLDEFLYRGSWGPIQLTGQQQEHVLRLGDYCARHTGWQGWLQLDFIEDAEGHLWLLEINPRWTAGMEVLLRASVCNPVTEHLQALRHRVPANAGNKLASHNSIACAKAVWYADRDLPAQKLLAATVQAQSKLDADSQPDFLEFTLCDVPVASGKPILTGHPGLTIIVKQLFATGMSKRRIRSTLLSHLSAAQRALLSCL